VIQEASGIKCYFDAIELDKDGKKAVQRGYSPVKGDIIRSVTK
jgi:hypothetical protein